MTTNKDYSVQRSLACSGSALFAIGLFTGVWTAAAFTGAVHLEFPRSALSAHLNALLGGLWLLALSYTIPFLGYNEKQLKILSLLATLPAWANWVITLAKSYLGVEGLTYTADPTNNAIAFLLQLFVVLPSLIASVYWVRGYFFSGE